MKSNKTPDVTRYVPRIVFEISDDMRTRANKLIPSNMIKQIYTAITEILLNALESPTRRVWIYRILSREVGLGELIHNPNTWIIGLIQEYLREAEVSPSEVTLQAFMSWMVEAKGIKVDEEDR